MYGDESVEGLYGSDRDVIVGCGVCVGVKGECWKRG